MRRQLPVFVEQSIHENQANRIGLADEFVSKIIGEKPLTCKAGCSACCYHPVSITILEAIPLYGALVEKGLWVPSLKEKLRRHAELVMDLDVQVWLLSKVACPLLSKDRCMAYDARPFGCRVTVATGNASYCDPQRLGDQTTIIPRGEVTQEFRRRETATLRKHGLMHLSVALSRALLMAERVCSGQIMLENIDRTYVAEYLSEGV